MTGYEIELKEQLKQIELQKEIFYFKNIEELEKKYSIPNAFSTYKGRRRHLISKPAGSGICEFSVRYVWNGAKARLRWNTSLPQRPLFHFPNPYLSKQTYKTLL